jgi:hypothetical protein
MIQGKSLVEVLPHVGALLIFALAFFFIAIWRFKYE